MIINGKWMSEPEIIALISQLTADKKRLERQVEQSVKRGRWIDHEKFERNNCNVCIECSVCNTWFGHDCIPKTKFCPNCGADMRGADDVQQI